MNNIAFWDKIAPKYANAPIRDPEGYSETQNKIKALLLPQHRVLELGCGTGSSALELASGVAEYVASDAAGEMIAIAKAKLGPDSPAQLRFVQSLATDLPPGPHDVILALNLLHLLQDMDAALRQIHEALPPDGLLIAKTPLLRDGAWFLPWLLRGMQMLGKAPDIGMLREAAMITALKTAGFEITEQLVQPGMVPRLFTVARKT
ncbi:MAG: methyltransferase domain-containing protein [Mangrovicoccus sp.]|nr:methyltransferase domain-containing protein [Mangrovicoccus sp.]